MERWSGKVAIVTGASCGIGLATAKALVQHDVVVIGFARRKNKMESEMQNVKGKDKGKFYACECDVSNPESVEKAFEWFKKNFGVVHILVNNSGVLTKKKLMDSSRSDWKQLFDVNVLGLIDCTKRAAKIMLDADVEGCIINISSIEGHAVIAFPGVTFNMYPATKFAVRAASEITVKELYGTKIRVTNLSPGIVETDIFKTSNVEFKTDDSPMPFLKPEDIADGVIYIIGTPQRVHIAELTIRPLGELKYEYQ